MHISRTNKTSYAKDWSVSEKWIFPESLTNKFYFREIIWYSIVATMIEASTVFRYLGAKHGLFSSSSATKSWNDDVGSGGSFKYRVSGKHAFSFKYWIILTLYPATAYFNVTESIQGQYQPFILISKLVQ